MEKIKILTMRALTQHTNTIPIQKYSHHYNHHHHYYYYYYYYYYNYREAFQDTPHNSILLLEDVDSLFSVDRKASNSKAKLSFSGLLNALDGVTAASGQIIILTTNHRERLDKAVTRNGRVDLHIPFPVMNHNQGMWYDGVM